MYCVFLNVSSSQTASALMALMLNRSWSWIQKIGKNAANSSNSQERSSSPFTIASPAFSPPFSTHTSTPKHYSLATIYSKIIRVYNTYLNLIQNFAQYLPSQDWPLPSIDPRWKDARSTQSANNKLSFPPLKARQNNFSLWEI